MTDSRAKIREARPIEVNQFMEPAPIDGDGITVRTQPIRDYISKLEALALLGTRPAPADRGEELIAAIEREAECLYKNDPDMSIGQSWRQATRSMLAAPPQPKEPQAEASGELAADEARVWEALNVGYGVSCEMIGANAGDCYGPEDWERAKAGYRRLLHALRPAPSPEKALRAPRSDGSGGWTLDYGYLNLIAETMNQEFRVGMEEIEAVILAHEATLAHEAPKDGSAEEGRA